MANVVHAPAGASPRTYVGPEALGLKYQLAGKLGLRGIGAWTASGRWPDGAPSTTAGAEAMWQSVEQNFLGGRGRKTKA
eukprot:SAG22_NODE_10426_length_536_cov_1.057208_1_plen_79_part_00